MERTVATGILPVWLEHADIIAVRGVLWPKVHSVDCRANLVGRFGSSLRRGFRGAIDLKIRILKCGLRPTTAEG